MITDYVGRKISNYCKKYHALNTKGVIYQSRYLFLLILILVSEWREGTYFILFRKFLFRKVTFF